MAELHGAGRALPQHLLLATDLSARCDRPLDRAVQLAGEWSAEVVALNVLEPAAAPDRALAWVGGASDEELLLAAREQLSRDLGGRAVPVQLRLARGKDAGVAIREAVLALGAEIVVTGVARNETLGRFLLGSTVESLSRTLAQPLLVVRERVRGPYRRIVVASDFSEASRQALLTAARLFPGRELVLYHCRPLALQGLAAAPSHAGLCASIEATEYAEFMAATPLPEGTTVRPVIECGAIESLLTRYARAQAIDLVVMGSHGRGGLMSLLLGSTAARLLDWLPCDTLLVRKPQTGA